MRVIKAIVVAGVVLLTGCNDPQEKLLEVFTKQGLTLLQPARDYIKIGGIVLLPKDSSSLAYEDPYDTLMPASGTSTNFQAVIQNQQDKSTSAVQVAVALSQIVSLPIGFSFENGQQTVTLKQVNASGDRYTSPMVSALLKKPDTAAEIKSRLKEGDRVFVIQEVYTANSLSVSATSGMSLAANVGGSPVTNKCGNGQQDGGQQGAGEQGAGKQDAGNTSTGKQDAGNTSTGKQDAGNTSAGKQDAGNQSAVNQGVSVGICRSTSAELSFTSQTAIPFAVRLNEVEVGPGEFLRVKYTGFRLPNLALGNESDVAATILIDNKKPMIRLKRIEHRQP